MRYYFFFIGGCIQNYNLCLFFPKDDDHNHDNTENIEVLHS